MPWMGSSLTVAFAISMQISKRHKGLLVSILALSGVRSGPGLQQVWFLRQFICSARLAQSAERKALNLVVVGSSPTVDTQSESKRQRRDSNFCCGQEHKVQCKILKGSSKEVDKDIEGDKEQIEAATEDSDILIDGFF